MRLSIILLLIGCLGFSQNQEQIHYRDLVETYYNKESTKPLYVYDAVNGNVIDTLNNIEAKNAYYKIAVVDSEYGWFKIKNIQRLPESYKNYGYEDHWVRASNFLIHVDNYNEDSRVYLYDLPSKKSNRIHKLDNYQKAHIIEISDRWAKVTFRVGKKEIEGWLDYKDQCAYPWTTCPKYD